MMDNFFKGWYSVTASLNESLKIKIKKGQGTSLVKQLNFYSLSFFEKL